MVRAFAEGAFLPRSLTRSFRLLSTETASRQAATVQGTAEWWRRGRRLGWVKRCVPACTGRRGGSLLHIQEANENGGSKREEEEDEESRRALVSPPLSFSSFLDPLPTSFLLLLFLLHSFFPPSCICQPPSLLHLFLHLPSFLFLKNPPNSLPLPCEMASALLAREKRERRGREV